MKKIRLNIMLLILVIIISGILAPSALAADTQTADTQTAAADGIGVQLGGEAVDFPDAKPVLTDGRTFVPVRAVLEALGAEVSYDQATGTVTAVRGDTTVRFYIGKTDIDITENGETRVFATDAASYISGDRLMAPARFISEAFGCVVGWDSEAKTVLILDKESVLSAAGDFTLMDKFLKYSSKYMQSGFTAEGTFDLALKVTQDGTVYPVISEGTVSAIYGGGAMNLDVAAETDFSGLSDVLDLGTESDVYRQTILSMFKNISISYIYDLNAMKIYMSSPLLSFAMGIPDGAWLAVDFGELYTSMGIDIGDYMSLYTNGTVTMKGLLESVLGWIELTDADQLADIQEALGMLQSICGDSAFVKSGSTYTDTQTYEGEDFSVSFVLKLTMSGDEVAGYAMTMEASGEEAGQKAEMSMDCAMKNDKATVKMSFTIPDALEAVMNMEMQYAATAEVPASAPPEGSTVVDMGDMFTANGVQA